MSLARIDVITLFPDWIEQLKTLGVTGRALAEDRVALHCWNPRDYADGVHRSVDDRPYGGGPGMVMRPEPLSQAIVAAKQAGEPTPVSLLSPQGRVLDQAAVRTLAQRPRLILVCGRYEGIDERVVDRHIDEEWSVGDFVLSGGEPAAAVLIDAVLRLVPNVLGHADSAGQDSFSDGLLDCPHFTRPEQWQDQAVPAVLLSGDHARIAEWRRAQGLRRTLARRPDLLTEADLSAEDRQLLARWPQDERQ